MPRKKKTEDPIVSSVVEEIEEEDEAEAKGPSEKERLLALYKTLQDLNVRSISDLENLIARA